jgi:23S rRNA pseudouridine1911/1915/1917 synthase
MNGSVEIPAALAGERVDRVVAILTGRSRAEVAELIAAGKVALSGRVVAVRHLHVVEGDRLDVDAEEIGLLSQPGLTATASVEFGVVYVDEALIVVDKPAGLVVHPGAGHRDDTLASGLLSRFPDLAAAAAGGAGDPSRPGIVHRLDKETSGLLVVARTPAAYASLVAQLAARTMGREYQALALGLFDNDAGVIEAPIGRSTRFPTKMAVHAGGRAARTRYGVVGRFRLPIAVSLVHLELDTGRTHQIRVHLAAIGHPIAGDSRYGGSVKDLPLGRPFLHAEALSLVHPVTGESMRFTSPLPSDLSACLAVLVA